MTQVFINPGVHNMKPLKCKSIVVIDDDPGIREMLSLVLELEGYTVFTASQGQDGLEKLKTVPLPCLILLDLMMPVMNGWEFLEELRKSRLESMTSVIVLTAFLDQTKTRPVIAQALLQKPIDLTVLLSLIQQYSDVGSEKASSLG